MTANHIMSLSVSGAVLVAAVLIALLIRRWWK